MADVRRHDPFLEGRYRDALAAVGAGLPLAHLCENWPPCHNDPVVRVGRYDFCADHAPSAESEEVPDVR